MGIKKEIFHDIDPKYQRIVWAFFVFWIIIAFSISIAFFFGINVIAYPINLAIFLTGYPVLLFLYLGLWNAISSLIFTFILSTLYRFIRNYFKIIFAIIWIIFMILQYIGIYGYSSQNHTMPTHIPPFLKFWD